MCRENVSTEKQMPVALACCWMIPVMMCASTPVSTPVREGGWMGVSRWMGDGPTSSSGATKQSHRAAHIIHVLLPSGSLAGWNAELALSLLSGIRVLVEAVDALDGLDDSAALPTSRITPEKEERHRVGM